MRAGDLREQTVSTWAKVTEAIERRDAEDVAELTAYAVDEATIHCDVMTQWRADLRELLYDKGASEDEVAEAERRLLDLLALPDGSRFEIATRSGVHCSSWPRISNGTPSRARGNGAAAQVDEARELWRTISDRDVDWCCGVMNEVVVRHGEEVVPEIWERILWPLFKWRYDKFDTDKADWGEEILPQLLYVALEAMRSYLSTPRRDGAPLELVEEDDRWIVRFDPCGSGGRSMRGEPIEDAPSRMEEPFNFRVIEGAYDWTDGKKGICVYCNHCQVLMEHWPMDRFGYPLRVVDPPTYPAEDPVSGRSGKCQWTMYKDPTTTPHEVYERGGRTKPAEFGSSAHPEGRRAADTTTILGAG